MERRDFHALDQIDGDVFKRRHNWRKPAGDSAETYEIVGEEQLTKGAGFEACRRTATYLMVRGRGARSGQTTMQMTTKEELEHATACDRGLAETTNNSDAALSPQKDTT